METLFIITGALVATFWGANKLAGDARDAKVSPKREEKYTSAEDFFLNHDDIASLRDVHVDALAKQIGQYDVYADGWDFGRWQYGWHTDEFTLRACTVGGHIQTIDLIKRGDDITYGESMRCLLDEAD